MKKLILAILLVGPLLVSANHLPIPDKKVPGPDFYRDLTYKIRSKVEFEIPFPGVKSTVNYFLTWDTPAYEIPILGDYHINGDKDPHFYRNFYDRIFTKAGSYIEINGEKLPLTCVFVNGQDNRFAGGKPTPLLPDYVFKIYFVANDFSCQGPIKPGWPTTGGKEENWDTYIYYEIRDPTIMLPTDAKIRYRWNETHMILVDRGN